VALTSAGEVLVEGARAVVAAASHALDRVDEVARGIRGRLAIGFSTAAGGVPVVREVIRRFSESAPDVDIRTQERDFSDPSAGLADGTAQVAFIFGPLPVEGLSSVTLHEEPRLVALRPDHALAGRATVRTDELVATPWLRVPGPDGSWQRFWFRHPAGGPSGPEIRTADEWVTAVEAGRGAAFTMPTVMANFANTEIRVLPVEDVPPAALLLAWRADDPDPLVESFVARALAVLTERASRG
jgi:DNA-binding transcriptional LysR family regulator